jgi:hypothetical protein
MAMASAAKAAVFCVDSEAGAQQALDQATANDEDDIVYLQAGTYPLTVGLDLAISQGEHADVSIRGGYDAGCNTRIGYTVLDGQNQVRPMWIHFFGSSDLSIEDVVFYHGAVDAESPSGANGGGMYVLADLPGAQAKLTLDSVRFLFNTAHAGYGGGLVVGGWVELDLRNSLFRGNTARDDGYAAFLGLYRNSYLLNNTVSSNPGNQESPGAAVFLTMAPGFTAWISNDIFWGNPDANVDLRLDSDSGGAYQLVANDIGTRDGAEPGEFSSSNLDNVDPQFEMQDFVFFDLPLKPTSPLIDAGENQPAGGLSASDLLGELRDNGHGVDIGAYEFDRIFADDFETPPSL